MNQLRSIYRFPIKSCGPNLLSSSDIQPTGLNYDRAFMIASKEGQFLTQREHPILSQISPKINNSILSMTHGSQHIELDIQPKGPILDVSVWKSKLRAHMVSALANEWLSGILGQSVALVRFSDISKRSKFVRPNGPKINLTFTDGYPLHLISRSSVKDLSRRLGEDISPLRFRPNFIIDGLEPYQEDRIDTIEGKNFKLKVVKPAGRCKIPNINPHSATEDQPVLKTLSTYMKRGNSVTFGVYAYPLKCGEAFAGEDLSLTYVQ